ncbi:MAG: hypothetical protein IJW64_07205 [Clostridia bacterium]|nr:hypothetical protein [Clostridia bacterium]
MKRILCLVFALLMAFTAISCGKRKDSESESVSQSSSTPAEVQVDSNYLRYDLLDPYATTLDGIGAQMDTDIFMPWNNMTPEDEALWEQRISDMNIQFTRIKFFPEFNERANDNADPNTFDYNGAGVDFNSVEMQALYKILDLCEKYDINVDLSWYGCYTWFSSYDGKYTNGTWMGYTREDVGPNHWVTAPKKTATFDGYAEYAENISITLKYLTEVKGYTCIYGFSVIAEMFMLDDGQGNAIISYDAYADCCKVVDERLEKDGLRDKFKFIGTSNQGHNLNYFVEEQEKTKDYFDIMGTGNYNWDYNDPIESAENYFADVLDIVHDFGKEGWYVAEFCQGKHFLDAVNKTDIDDYTAGMYISRFVLAALNQGVTAFNHYILGDTYFTNSYVHTMGLWQYRDKDWKAHPEYYFFGLITKYSDIGSTVYPVERNPKKSRTDDIIISALKLPDGGWTYYISNKAGEAKRIAIVNQNAGAPTKLNAYKITESAIPEDRACVLPAKYTEINCANQVTYVTVPACGFVVLSTR